MSKIFSGGLRAALVSILAIVAAPAGFAQEPTATTVTPAQPTPAPNNESWYYRAAPEREPTFTVAQQKAQARGAQRMARLEALRWYGFSNSRPVAAAMPWTTMYSPAWQMPGGRPFAWHTSSRPIVIHHVHPMPVYR